MTSRKVLKSVAHSFGHSFASTLNYRERDYALGHLLRRARELEEPSVVLDILTGEISPVGFADSPGGRALEDYSHRFPGLVTKHGFEPQHVPSAHMVITFDLSEAIPSRSHSDVRVAPSEPGSPYDLTVTLVDDTGREWSVTQHGWQYPSHWPR